MNRLPTSGSLIGALLLASVVGALAAGTQVAPTPVPGLLVDVAWVAARLSSPGLVVLHVAKDDVRYLKAHVPGARLVRTAETVVDREGHLSEIPPLAALTELVRRLGITGEEDRIVLYDEGSGLDAARAFLALETTGLGGRLSLLDGHFGAWTKAGRPTSYGPVEVGRSGFLPRPRHDLTIDLRGLRDLAWVVNDLPAGAAALIDARPEEQYQGTDPGPGVTRPGHIDGAVNVFWKHALRGPDDARLRPLPELQALYREALQVPPDQVVTYCRTGVQASHAYFVLRYLGLKPRLYDASFLEWSRQPDTPVTRGPYVR